jgi:hypothetical protein
MHTFKVAKVSGSEPCFRVLAPDGIPNWETNEARGRGFLHGGRSK